MILGELSRAQIYIWWGQNATCPQITHLSFSPIPCHFQCENLPTCPGKNIPRDLVVTWNFLNLNEFWEFVKMCETSPKVNSGKFLKARVSQRCRHPDTGHTWQKRQSYKICGKFKINPRDIDPWCWNKQQTQTRDKPQQGRSKPTGRANRNEQ